MCYSIADDGQCCAPHTRVAFRSAEAQLQQAKDARLNTRGLNGHYETWQATAVAYASTPEGRAHFTRIRDGYALHRIHGEAARYNHIIAQGDDLRAVNAEITKTARYRKRNILTRALRRPTPERAPEDVERRLALAHRSDAPGSRSPHTSASRC